MGIEVIAAAALALNVVGAINQADAAKKAKDAQEDAQREQRAANAAQAAQERRQQIREERIKRARIVQASSNTGVSESSGEIGATGGLATQLGGNIGFNLGQLAHAQRTSESLQKASDYQTSAANWGAIGGVGRSIFSLTAGSLFQSADMSQPPAPVETRTPM